jgi:hypothetical protein
MTIERDNLARQFLLGKLSEEESLKIEEDYFTGKNLFEDILEAENDLIDDYAMGKLSPEDKIRFERRLLLNPKQRRRLEFAETLVEYASDQPLAGESKFSAGNSSWISIFSQLFSNKSVLSLSFSVAALIVFGGGIWLVLDKSDSESERVDKIAVSQSQEPSRSESPQTTIATKNTGEIADSKPHTAASPQKNVQSQPEPQTKQEKTSRKQPPVIYSLILSPGLTRDSGTSQRFTVPAKTDFINMRLKFEERGFSSYSAVLETVEGRQVWSGSKLKARKDEKFVTFQIPSKLLKKSDYILTLKGLKNDGIYENIEDYTFTVYR